MSVEDTLKERGSRYGEFPDHARISQAIQKAFREGNYDTLPDTIKQGLTTIADKIARILNGDPLYEDNYHDIGGYAKLMEDFVINKNTNIKVDTPTAASIVPVLTSVNTNNFSFKEEY